jgi:hypothetical protein
MGLVNRQHFLDAHVNFISANKLPKQAEHLLTRIKRMKKLLPHYQDERERVLEKAGGSAAKGSSSFNEAAAIKQFYDHIIPAAALGPLASDSKRLENKVRLLSFYSTTPQAVMVHAIMLWHV